MTFRFGPISFDTSQIEASAPSSYQTGYTKITGLINSVINGTGFPFLVSMNDVPSGDVYTYDYLTEDYDGFRATEFSKVFINGSGITHSLLSNITGEKIVISGVEPDIKGIVPPRGGGNTVITVTGYSFYNITGIRLTDVPSESTECFVESGDFVAQTGFLTTVNSLGELVLTPHTGFHIENLGPETILTTNSQSFYPHELTFKVCSEFITNNIDKAYIYSMHHTGTTGELTIPGY